MLIAEGSQEQISMYIVNATVLVKSVRTFTVGVVVERSNLFQLCLGGQPLKLASKEALVGAAAMRLVGITPIPVSC